MSATVSDGTTSKTTTYNYSDHTNGEKANFIESVELPTATVTYDYDDFYRASYDVEVNGSDILTTDYTFLDGLGENSTTTLVESMTTSGGDWSETLSYTYDCKGNIETISENGTQKAKYYYDDLNQLVREDNAWTNKTVVYTYDNGGNILLVSEYLLTSASDISSLVASSTDIYTYGDSNWKDKLTSFNGNEITYDEIGNPISYYNGLTFDWQNGRQLASVSGNGLDISYTYNADGIRTSKTVNGVTTTYTLEGSNIVKETNSTDTLWYYYDAAGSLTGFELNGTPYFYVKNVQRDIIAITDANGNIVVEYLYDSWDDLLSTTGSLADTVGIKNPFRYRGYYYDIDTGLYYANSRYYDSNIVRFINADTTAIISASPGSANYDKNLFAYCDNNPVVRIDSDGNWWQVISAVVGGLVNGGIQLYDEWKTKGSLSDVNWGKVAVATAGGAISGLCGPIGGAICDGLTSLVVNSMDGDKSAGEIIKSVAIDVGCSFIGSGISEGISQVGGDFLARNWSRNTKGKLKCAAVAVDSTIRGSARNEIKSTVTIIKSQYMKLRRNIFKNTNWGKTTSIISDAITSLLIRG